ncbi:IclR family transcriptional regulator [Protaetiibacter intestinalis]|uniref:IclR family transcriptional regulator n=1 Tax=Protaetiibacter intestinalis TaxID=2419774 RepID=A0A387B9L0_9MICO|nr:IclR family transcriptional regulator [Protaetiibacter intestinalis]AYF97619.1 IclR family transcriptional regulator [Protaetiibacter intestinalis]
MLTRAFQLLDAFTPDRPELTLRELAARAGVPRSTTHRLVGELLAWGALERGPRGVRLGVKLFELGALAPTPNRLVAGASAHLHALREVTGLTANLAIREGGHLVYLDKIGARDLRVPHSRLGGRGALHATALGKAILAFSPQPDVDELLAHPLAALTRATITDPDALRTELARVRRAGAAYDLAESFDGLFCVAAPVRDRRGAAVAALSVTGATARAQAERFAPAVIATARTLERELDPGRRIAT